MRGNKLPDEIRSNGEFYKYFNVGVNRGQGNKPSRVKSKSGGKSFPLGILAPSTRNSSKKGWTMASIAHNLACGVYSNSLDTKSIASGAVRGRKTCCEGYVIPELHQTTPYFRKWMWFDLWELVLHIVRVHRANLIARRSAEHFDDLDELIDTGFTREERLSEHQLCHNTSRRPHICR